MTNCGFKLDLLCIPNSEQGDSQPSDVAPGLCTRSPHRPCPNVAKSCHVIRARGRAGAGGVCLPGWLGLWLVVFVSETESPVAQDSLELTVHDLRLLTLLGLLPKPGLTGVHCHTQTARCWD